MLLLMSAGALRVFGPGLEEKVSVLDLQMQSQVEVPYRDLGLEEEGGVHGPDLMDLLAKLQVDTSGIEELVLRAGDGYRANLFPDLLRDCKVVLLHDLEGTPLEASGPVYSVMPDCPVMHWVRDLRSVEIVSEDPGDSVASLSIIRPGDILARAEVQDFGDGKFFGLPVPSDGDGRLEVRSRDGLRRRYAGEELVREDWMIANYHGRGFDFVARDVHRGVWMRDVLLLLQGGEAFLFPPDPEEGEPSYTVTLEDLFPRVTPEIRSLTVETRELVAELHPGEERFDLAEVAVECEPGVVSLRIGSARFPALLRVDWR
jgi:hypothetical protein